MAVCFLVDNVFCIGDTEEEEEQADYTTASESASQSQLDVSASKSDEEVKSPSVQTPTPKIASPVQQVILYNSFTHILFNISIYSWLPRYGVWPFVL